MAVKADSEIGPQLLGRLRRDTRIPARGRRGEGRIGYVTPFPAGRTLPSDMLGSYIQNRNDLRLGERLPDGAGRVAGYLTLAPGAREAIVFASSFAGRVF